MRGSYVLDTSAILCFIRNEQGSDVVYKIIQEAQRNTADIYVSFMSFMEIYYMIWRYKNEDAAKDTVTLMNELPISQVHSYDQLALNAGWVKANHKLSVADAFIAATAIEKKAILVHKDPEFESLSKDIQMLPLPYKTAIKNHK